jgi:hypothetical protein
MAEVALIATREYGFPIAGAMLFKVSTAERFDKVCARGKKKHGPT